MTMNLLTGPRRGMGGPFNVLLRSPEMGDLAQKLGEYARFRPDVPAKLRELAIIVTARHWTAQYEWYAHRRAAAQAGLKEDIIKAIADRKRPTGMQPDEEAVYNFANETSRDQATSAMRPSRRSWTSTAKRASWTSSVSWAITRWFRCC